MVILAAAAGLFAGGSAASSSPQSDVVFVRLSVDLWPDYDRRGVLVIYRGNLAPGVELPATLGLSIPAAAGTPTAVAERHADGQLVNLPFERRVDGETAVIEAQVTRRAVQLEYYDPGLSAEGSTRSFSYQWPGDVEVGELTVTVQQPDLASELATEPAAASRAPGADGLVYHTVGLGARAQGERATVGLSYTKPDDRLTVETMDRAVAPIPQVLAPPPESPDELSVVVVGVAMLVLGIAAALLFFRSRQEEPDRPAPARDSGLCTRCGAEAAASDRFCHRCGQPLRRSVHGPP